MIGRLGMNIALEQSDRQSPHRRACALVRPRGEAMAEPFRGHNYGQASLLRRSRVKQPKTRRAGAHRPLSALHTPHWHHDRGDPQIDVRGGRRSRAEADPAQGSNPGGWYPMRLGFRGRHADQWDTDLSMQKYCA